MTDAPPTFAFLYDRHTGARPGTLDARLGRCSAYAEACGWREAGRWVDTGDAAVGLHPEERPAWQRMLAVVRGREHQGCEVVVVVHDRSRLAHDALVAAGFVYQAKTAGARVVTASGTDAPQDL